jgi:colanic acid/amylovoran biosynthesis glycosyltransferase
MQVLNVVPPILRDLGQGLEVDVDFVEVLGIYLEHFRSMAVACPVRTSDIEGSGLERCRPVTDLAWGPTRLKFIPLPTATRPIKFLRHLSPVRRTLRREILAAEYLVVTPYSLFGDWPTVAIREAILRDIPYVIEADGVHSDIMRMRANNGPQWKRIVKKNILIPLFELSHEYCLKHSALAVFQGQDVFNAYAPLCRNPYKLNHHIPIYPGEHITHEELEAKLTRIRGGEPLKLCYVGRAVDMKAPLQWMETLHALSSLGVSFNASWLGDGPLLQAMREKASSHGLRNITFAGYISDRASVLRVMKDAHLFLFTHITLESARILGEALACGCPLVGYGSAYPADLVATHGGGTFTDIGDAYGLAKKVKLLNDDRRVLTSLVRAAAISGRDFNRPAELHKRANIVKHLGKYLAERNVTPAVGAERGIH